MGWRNFAALYLQEMAEAEEAAEEEAEGSQGERRHTRQPGSWMTTPMTRRHDEADDLVEYDSDPEQAQAPATIVAVRVRRDDRVP